MLPIRLIAFDIDGVLNSGETTPLDFGLMMHLSEMNRLAREDPSRPAVTICTGRPAPFAEAFVKAVDGHLPAVFENGCGLYQPRGYRFVRHPSIGDVTTHRAIRQRIDETLAAAGKVFVQLGKEYSVTIFPCDGVPVADLYPLAEEALGPLREAVDMLWSSSCLNIVPRGMNKGVGLRYLCERNGYAAEEVLGVGDDDVDLSFLDWAGYAAAPANASANVRQVVDYLAPRDSTDGVRDILNHYGLMP